MQMLDDVLFLRAPANFSSIKTVKFEKQTFASFGRNQPYCYETCQARAFGAASAHKYMIFKDEDRESNYIVKQSWGCKNEDVHIMILH